MACLVAKKCVILHPILKMGNLIGPEKGLFTN